MSSLPTRIGLFGGTFDPVHIGHLRAALEVAEALALDELRLIPSARPPHREAPSALRPRMPGDGATGGGRRRDPGGR